MAKWDHLKLQDFLSLHPKIRLTELGEECVVEGEYWINAQMKGYNPIRDTYHIKIVFPPGYPRSLPVVYETDSRIPRELDYHTYKNGSLCLGSEIKLKSILFESSTIADFVENILNPFLYAVSHKLLYNVYPFGELDHGEDGLIDDYQRVFNVAGKVPVMLVLVALSKRKRNANKLPCPCGCGFRLGKCDFRFSLKKWRRLDKRRWFKEHLLTSFKPLEKPIGKGSKSIHRHIKWV